jgi:Lon protease-like protein
VAIFNAATGKADRVGIKVTGDKRVRVLQVQRRRNQGGMTMARLQQHYREKVAPN